MGRSWLGILLVLVLLTGTAPLPSQEAAFLDEAPLKPMESGTSGLTIAFSNGPSQDQEVNGLLTLTFSIIGTGTLDSLMIEITDDDLSSSSVDWSTVINLTETPWMYPFDSTDYSNGSYTIRAVGWDSDAEANTTAQSGSFNITNQVPEITIFTALNPDVGAGSSISDRAWYNIASTGTISFRWGANDDDLKQATLTTVPGPGTPATDGPTSIAYGWDWASGNMAEGTWSPRLTVYDQSGLSNTSTLHIGIDRTGPTMGAITVGDGSTWHQSGSVTISNLMTAANDGQGSGVSSVQYMVAGAATWTTTTSNSVTLTFAEGSHELIVRAIDRVGNVGANQTISINIDETEPVPLGWTVDELTTSRIGAANVSFAAEDLGSGMDNVSSYIQYGFDSNGVGQTPDLSGRWLNLGVNGLDGQIGLSSWVTKSRQHIMLRAFLQDEAGNTYLTEATSFQILPGLDLYWNASQTNLDRLVVRPGEQNGNITITSVLESNQDYPGSVIVRLESAPADRSSNVQWTVMETRNLPLGALSNSTETITWQYTVPSSGQFDLRLVIDFANVIDEYDEGNNANYLVVTGASLDAPGTVPSFAPSLLLIVLVGFGLSLLQRKTRD
ncbi:MAG: hypothetical protein CMA65_06140 [Euryarchaeota archaeon]|nr:hypothetical protein [Euryarchaeota archaeon]